MAVMLKRYHFGAPFPGSHSYFSSAHSSAHTMASNKSYSHHMSKKYEGNESRTFICLFIYLCMRQSFSV